MDMKHTSASSQVIAEGHGAHILWKERGSQQLSEIEFSIHVDKDFLTMKSTILLSKFPTKIPTYLNLKQMMLSIAEIILGLMTVLN